MPEIQLPVFLGLEPTARSAFGQGSLEFLSAFFRQKVIINNFMHPNDVTVAVDAGVVGPPAQAAFPLKLTASGNIGTTYAATLETRTSDPYRGLQVCRFVPGSANGNQCQWHQGSVGVGYAGADHTLVAPMDVLFCTEVALSTSALQGGMYIGMYDPGVGALLDGAAGLNFANGNSIGFYASATGELQAVYGSGANDGTIKPLGVFLTQAVPVQLAIRWHHVGRSGGAFHPNSFIQYYINGELKAHVDAAMFGQHPTNNPGPSNQLPVVAVNRVTGAYNLCVPYWAMGYNVVDAVYG